MQWGENETPENILRGSSEGQAFWKKALRGQSDRQRDKTMSPPTPPHFPPDY